MSDLEIIYLQPECCADPAVGRLWCEDDSPVDCEDGKPWTKYVRADEIERLQARVGELEQRQKWLDQVGPPAHPDDERHFAMAYVREKMKTEKAEERVAELEAESKESDYVRDQLAQLLAKTVLVLRGEPPPKKLWSYHDIPDLTAELKAERDAARAEVERLAKHLKAANSQAERFEREWYLRGDEIEKLKKDAERFEYILDCEVIAARRYLPELNESEFKAKRRAAIDAAIAKERGA